MKLHAVRFASTDFDRAEALCELLEAHGALAVELRPDAATAVFDEPHSHATPWRAAEVSALTGVEDPWRWAGALAAAASALPDYRVEAVPDRDWPSEWQAHFPPRVFGGRLCVCPAHIEPEPSGLPIVRLDPGRAFGTGHHASTQLCLNALCETVGAGTGCVVDYGCGSGILAIAAAKLGAQRVFAVDLDPAALAVCRENAQANQVCVEPSTPAALPAVQTDVLVANILLESLITLAPRLAALLGNGGSLLLSGLLRKQAETCMAAYQPWFNWAAPRYQDEWVLLRGTRR